MSPLAVLAVLAVLAARAGALPLGDPTRPDVYRPAAPAEVPRAPVEWRLTFIRIGAHGARAVLNGRTVRAGDVIGETRVVEIRAGAVVLDEAGERRVVDLLPSSLPSSDRASDPAAAEPDAADRQPSAQS